jgi:endonuclease/exonuclease/phosphatase family metal-dependent hydrolase
MTRIVSWNLLHSKGARAADVARLVKREHPDLLMLQEATLDIDALPALLGGSYQRIPLPGRLHGLAMWSPTKLPPIRVLVLPSGPVVKRVCQIADFAEFSVANVHLSHGQVMNRRQLRHIERHMPRQAAVLGDYNIVGPALLPEFRDVGPRQPTHICADMLPLRLDRCYVRALICSESRALDWCASDHRAIVVRLLTAEPFALAA